MTYTANAPMDFKIANNIRELGGYVNKDGVSLKKAQTFARRGSLPADRQ